MADARHRPEETSSTGLRNELLIGYMDKPLSGFEWWPHRLRFLVHQLQQRVRRGDWTYVGLGVGNQIRGDTRFTQVAIALLDGVHVEARFVHRVALDVATFLQYFLQWYFCVVWLAYLAT